MPVSTGTYRSEVVRALQPGGAWLPPLFQVMFAPQDGVSRTFEMGDVEARASGLANSTAKSI
jgi:hypothetical protein